MTVLEPPAMVTVAGEKTGAFQPQPCGGGGRISVTEQVLPNGNLIGAAAVLPWTVSE